MKSLSKLLLCSALVLAWPAPARAELQGSVFTYQGRLEQAGVAVDGTRNLRFRLYTAAVGGTQLGGDIALPGQAIEDGVFSVPLDFGLLAFNGEARFLEIAVDDNTLAPRQLVTNAPYALFALDGGTAYGAGPGIAVNGSTISANFGTTAGTVAQGNTVVLNQSTQQMGAAFNITGRGKAGEFVVDSQLNSDSSQPVLRVRSPLQTGNPLGDRFRVDTAGGLVAIGELGFGILPASGPGERMMWHPFKAAFRAGGIAASEWDDSNVGFYSAAFGNDVTASGFASLAVGDDSSASGTSAFAMGKLVTADGSNSIALGRSVSSGTFSGGFIWGDASTATVASNTATNQFVARAAGGFRFRTNATLTTGCDLPAGSGVFNCTSDRNAKHDFRRMDAEDILLRLTAIPVDSWRYRDEHGGVRHIGPTAQDFRAAFGLGTDDVSIGLLDLDGVNMLAIQALAARTDELSRKTREVDALRTQLETLGEKVARIEAQLQK